MTNCTFTANSAALVGGALYNYSGGSTLIISKCTFTTNIAGTSSGGAISSMARTLIYNSTFASNSCGDNGGSLYLGYTSSSETNIIDGSVFLKNTSADNGGAIYNGSSRSFEGSNCGFTNNSTASAHGGAIEFAKEVGNILITDCSFNTNTASSSGGALYFADPTVPSPIYIANGVFLDNIAANGSGGAVYDRERPMLVNDSTFTGNFADDNGGAAYLYNVIEAGSTNKFINCAFANNRADYEGGAIYFKLQNSSVNYSVLNCSFFTNTTYRKGGGIRIEAGVIGVTNCIFWNGDSEVGWTDSDAIYVDNGETLNIAYSSVNTNEIDNNSGTVNYGSGVIYTNPLFVSELTYDLHLKSQHGHWTGSEWSNDAEHSPCIDSGDPSSDFSNEPTSGARINMGAYGNTAYASKSATSGTLFLCF
ncbi:hypothetical protein H8D64_00995 [PVC group bacterium]|nr:hypothetical protein [PVC group bacterium]